MLQKDKNTLDFITILLQKLFDLNTRGHFTGWLDWSGYSNSIRISITKGKWIMGKDPEVVYEALVCKRDGIWRDCYTGKNFDAPEFFSLVRSLSEYQPLVEIKRKKTK